VLAFAAGSATVVSESAVSAVVVSSEVWEATAAWDRAISSDTGFSDDQFLRKYDNDAVQIADSEFCATLVQCRIRYQWHGLPHSSQ